jgi:hypothetical protein
LILSLLKNLAGIAPRRSLTEHHQSNMQPDLGKAYFIQFMHALSWAGVNAYAP